MRKPFNLRSFISFCLFFSIAWLLITGSVLYISPPGRIANWDSWTLLGFTKRQWQAQHTIFSYTFVIIAIIHIFTLNWKNLWSYIKLKTRSGIRRQKELGLSILLIFMIFFATSFSLPPFWSFYELGDHLKHSWENKTVEAPMPHAEALTIKEFSEKIVTQTPEEIIQLLREAEIDVINSNQTIAEIAENNEKSPAQLFRIIQGQQTARSGERFGPGEGRSRGNSKAATGSGNGYGRMTVSELALSFQHTPEEVIDVLKKEGIQAGKDETIRDIATNNAILPHSLVQLILEKFE